MTREEIGAAIDELGLSSLREEILSSIRPSIRIQATPVDEQDLPLGASRMGGSPDLPPDFEWPFWMTPEGDHYGRRTGDLPRPNKSLLQFIAQINLTDLRGLETDIVLPESGWLYFFYDTTKQPWGFDPDDRGGHRVLYWEGTAEELRRTEPKGSAEDFQCRASGLHFRSELTVASELSSDKHIELADEYMELELKSLGVSSEFDPIHRMGGHPQNLQGPMKLECQMVTNGLYCGDLSAWNDKRRSELEPGAKDWRLLLQVSSDEDDLGWMWGDCGRIYFWIREQDLCDLAFDQTWVILQCA